MSLTAVRSLVKFLHTATGFELMPGVVAVIQTFGDRINFHPHIHVLITEGGTTPDGAFHRVCRFHDKVIQEIFTREVFSLLLRKKLIGLPLVQKILGWRYTGFNVHSKVRATDKEEGVRVGKYMIRPLLSLKRLFFSHIPDKGQVMVRYYGLYSNAHRGKIRKAASALSPPPIIEDEPNYVPSKGWAEMIRKVYEVDPPPPHVAQQELLMAAEGHEEYF